MNKDSKQLECVWERAKDELARELDLEKNIPYPYLVELHMRVSGPREITIENPYRAPCCDKSAIDRHKENLIADKFKALLKQKYPEDSEWEIKWVSG